MSQKTFYSGMEEAVARILALFVTLAFFSVYILSKGVYLNLDWTGLTIHLSIFWFVYELISYIVFLILSQFSKSKLDKNQKLPILSIKEDEPLDNNESDVQKIN